MSGLRHDARRCREDAKSQRIRMNLGIRFPEEIEAERRAEEERRQAQKKEATKGTALPGLEEDSNG